MTAALVVLFEDDAMLVIDKPSGLSVHRGLAAERDTVATRLAAQRMGPVHLVHRLDRGTSGALVIAKTREAAAALGAELADGSVEKVYLAIVRGVPPAEVLVDHPIPCDEGGSRVAATTHLRTLATGTLEGSTLRERRYSLVEARPQTGRFHQVRRHLKHLGHPLVGDTTYGRSEHNRAVRAACGLDRLALHACSIRIGGVTVAAPVPADLARALGALGLAPNVDCG